MRIILLGAKGQMGTTLKGLWLERSKGVQFIEPELAQTLQKAEKADLLIDFSHASAIKEVLTYGLRTKTPLLIAATGHDDLEKNAIYEASEEIPIFYTANLSFGVYVLKMASALASQLLGDLADIEIVEKHHKNKLDAPSGTALMLLETLSETRSKTRPVFGRQGQGAREKEEIGIHAIRGGSITGEHTIVFAMDGEHIEMTHRGESKRLFASGAYEAAHFLITKEKGLYTIDDLVKGRLK